MGVDGLVRCMLRQWCCMLCLALATLGVHAMDVGAPGTRGQDVTPHFAYLQDTTNTLTLAQAQQAFAGGQFTTRPDAATALKFGFGSSAYWLRLALRNPADQASAQMLQIANAQISSVVFYSPDATGTYRSVMTGSELPFATRAYANRNYVLPLDLPARAEQVVYLRLKTNLSLNVPAQLWPKDDFLVQARDDYAVQAGYIGLGLAMLVFNLLLFITLRDRIYLLYVAFLFFVMLVISSKNGLSAEFLWPARLVWGNFLYYTCASFAFVALAAFTRHMLTTARVVPALDRGLKVLMVVHLLAPLVYWSAIAQTAPLTIAAFMATAIYLFWVGLWCAIKRMRSAYFYVGAFVMLMVGGSVTLMRTLDWLPTNAFTVDGLQLGSSLEMLLLAFALADRYNILRQEKLQAQHDLLDAQRENERNQELQVLNEKLEALAMVDGLTGIANRRQFDQTLTKEWARIQRLEQPLAVLMLDVDWFKAYNDNYGHQAGDACLRAVAQAMAGLCRSSDLVARYGGEEFVLIAPAIDNANALVLAQRACEAVQALALEHANTGPGVITISAGVAVAVPGPSTSAQALLQAADAALYQAKAQGRNCAVLAA
jgi:diguanylate cyclase (GGDEF)-like protein